MIDSEGTVTKKPAPPPFWEQIDITALLKKEGPSVPKNRYGYAVTYRGKVPGGWLYRVMVTQGNSTAHDHMTFVEDPREMVETS